MYICTVYTEHASMPSRQGKQLTAWVDDRRASHNIEQYRTASSHTPLPFHVFPTRS